MTELTVEQAKEQKPRAKLACRLHKKTHGRAATWPTAGEFELENVSEEVFEIEVQMSVLQYLNLIVTGPDGAVVSERYYGDMFSPVEKAYCYRLNPGEKFTAPVSFLATVPKDKQKPGRYRVEAVYEYKETRAVSEPYFVELTEKL